MVKKLLGILGSVTLLLVITVIQVFAAPSPAVGEGTITAIIFETDVPTAVTTVVVTLEDSDGLVQTVRLSLDSAVAEGLIIPFESLVTTDVGDIFDTDGVTVLASGMINSMAFVTDPPPTILAANITTPEDTTVDPPIAAVTADYEFSLEVGVFNSLIIVDETMIGTAAAFDPAIILDSTEYGKVVSKVGSFFGTALGVDYATLQAYQDDGFGYGVIVQASWMAVMLEGDAETLDQILAAKESGDFSGVVLPDGSTAKNWGQLRKAVLTDPKQNPGQIISGKAEPLPTETETVETEPTETPTETPTDEPITSSSQSANGNSDEKTNNGKAPDEKTNNGKKPDEKTNNGVGNTKDKDEKTNNGKKP